VAEFAEVMRQWVRAKIANSGGDMPLCSVQAKCIDAIEIKKIEQEVMAWAEENPEPVYPTWEEWLNSLGLIMQKEGTFTEYRLNEIHSEIMQVNVLTSKGDQHIPADIAEKLGIEPKEG